MSDTFTYTASFTASELSQPRVHKFASADGYEQRIKFGLYTDAKEWDLQFNNRTDAERDSILAFFEVQAGATSFYWTPPRGTAGKYVCEQWSLSMEAYGFNNIRAKFRQVFEA
jgi:phage-related protein